MKMSKPEKSEIYYKEYDSLRAELRDLKECQVRFLTFSVTASGLIFGIVSRFGTDLGFLTGIFYMIPLTIIIPAWFIFFDKATTITRAVAYFRILEGYILNKKEFDFLGFENSLAKFRSLEKEGSLHFEEEGLQFRNIPTDIKQRVIRFFRWPKKHYDETNRSNIHSTGRYWFMVHLTYAGLALTCFFLALTINWGLFPFEIIFFSMILGISYFTLWKNSVRFKELTNGKHSYTQNYAFWEKDVLEIKEIAEDS